MSSAYGVVNFALLHMRLKLTGSMESSSSLFVMSLFLPKNTLVSCPLLHALSALAEGSWSVAFIIYLLRKKGCSLMAF